ncbi:hypothetical protein IW262DRAFT_1485823 [Armillaria fumosa]|nr:hypothetical protein IW262DRAFT_1485823 [Armillaria fumosa]
MHFSLNGNFDLQAELQSLLSLAPPSPLLSARLTSVDWGCRRWKEYEYEQACLPATREFLENNGTPNKFVAEGNAQRWLCDIALPPTITSFCSIGSGSTPYFIGTSLRPYINFTERLDRSLPRPLFDPTTAGKQITLISYSEERPMDDLASNPLMKRSPNSRGIRDADHRNGPMISSQDRGVDQPQLQKQRPLSIPVTFRHLGFYLITMSTTNLIGALEDLHLLESPLLRNCAIVISMKANHDIVFEPIVGFSVHFTGCRTPQKEKKNKKRKILDQVCAPKLVNGDPDSHLYMLDLEDRYGSHSYVIA